MAARVAKLASTPRRCSAAAKAAIVEAVLADWRSYNAGVQAMTYCAGPVNGQVVLEHRLDGPDLLDRALKGELHRQRQGRVVARN